MPKKLIISILLLGAVLNVPSFALAQGEAPIQAPETVQEAQQFGIQILQGIPGAVKEVWDTQVMPLWTKMWHWVKNLWDSTIYSFVRGIWDRVLSFFGQEIEKRKPLIEEEFQKEKQELQQEIEESIPQAGKTLWERLKGFFQEQTPPETLAPSRQSFLVKPYLVYPADKPMIPEYEKALASYLSELQLWYQQMTGAAFVLAPLEIQRSSFDYLTMRCGENPSQQCLNEQNRIEGNWPAFLNKAIHGGKEEWEEKTVALIFSAGGGGFAGANQYPNYTGFAITGDWVLEPISGIPNDWGIPCRFSDGWQCQEGVPKGSPAHELGHAFGLPHPDEYEGESIMKWHGGYPETGFLPHEVNYLLQSPFFQ